MSSNAHARRRADLWILLVVFGIIVGLGFGLFLLFDWADEQGPWFMRVAVVLLGTFAGIRLGSELHKRPKEARGTNWVVVGMAFAGFLLAGYFGMYRPAVRDRERDRAFNELIAEARKTTESLNEIGRELPPVDQAQAALQIARARLATTLQRSVEWMDRYRGEMERYTQDQRRELHDEFKRMLEVATAVRERLAQWAAQDAKKK